MVNRMGSFMDHYIWLIFIYSFSGDNPGSPLIGC